MRAYYILCVHIIFYARLLYSMRAYYILCALILLHRAGVYTHKEHKVIRC
jgi:hypothetical protein